ncbi:2-hydroxychromene-2-carboxylate isomerase [Phreatobacter stygius]|uniref:2-hydroxychromene-2-carboxylate isomerase n=1 Tax=Phreatobacter stygius TaxID=1940610 RepID=A0A4D7B1P7_9HYPH|nr:DsbA family protein [Phreatobacter stygius]QCI63436.1 hypothetical protein E8M01_03795 [Phreatobacter stygius]
MAEIQFFFEFASPYSYIASLDIEDIAAAAGRTVAWRPVEIDAVWEAQGVLDAYRTIRRLKGPYIRRDAMRCAARRGASLRSPSASARDTSLAKSAYWGLRDENTQLAKRFLQVTWHRYFSEGKPIGSLEDIVEATDSLGLGAQRILTAAAWAGARRDQDASNADAIAGGCFGIPWFIADGEAFFGQDRLSHLAAHINPKPGRQVVS